MEGPRAGIVVVLVLVDWTKTVTVQVYAKSFARRERICQTKTEGTCRQTSYRR